MFSRRLVVVPLAVLVSSGVGPALAQTGGALCQGPVVPDPAPSQVTALDHEGFVVDVLWVYTADAANSVGGISNLDVVAERARDAANRAYANSGITFRLRSVGVRMIDNYNEAGRPLVDILGELRSTSDGQLDIVHAWRNELGADFVHLLVSPATNGFGGIGFLMGRGVQPSSFADSAFSVSNVQAALMDSITPEAPAHELGHNMGLMHANTDETGIQMNFQCVQAIDGNGQPVTVPRGRTNYAYGWRDPDGGFETYMAKYGTARGIEYFSNPDVVVDTTAGPRPTGTRDLNAPCPGSGAADSTRALNEVRAAIVGFRSQTIPVAHRPGAILLSAPDNGEIVDTPTPTFAWEALPPLAPYQLKVEREGTTVVEATRSPAECDGDPTVSVNCSVPSPVALADGQYSWFVRAANDVGETTSATWTFTTASGTADVCPDSVCTSGETCDTCSQDCVMSQAFTISGEPLFVGVDATFSADVSRAWPGSQILWDMGDATHLDGESISYNYAAPGTYTVVLTSIDGRCGMGILTSAQVTVSNLPFCSVEPFVASCCGNGVCEQGEVNQCADCPPLPSCGEKGGDECMQVEGCPTGYSRLGRSNDCVTCCKLDPGVQPPPPSQTCEAMGGECSPTPECPAGHTPLGAASNCGTCCDPPPPPPLQTCGAMGGDECSQTSSCPSGYTPLGQSSDCVTCCDATPPPLQTCGAMGGDECSQTSSCPSGYTPLGQSSDCITCCDYAGPDCSDPTSHDHSGSCGETDACGHSFGGSGDCGCPGDNHDHSGSCGETDACGHSFGGSGDCGCPGDSHDHSGSCGSVDACGHGHGSSTDCGCPDAPIVYDTCWNWVCDTGSYWVDEWCDSCNWVCDTCTDCWTNCDEEGNCWDECSSHDCNCRDECSSYVCGGHWESYEYNCRWESYQCNPHQCGF
jgi:PKD repeat protein